MSERVEKRRVEKESEADIEDLKKTKKGIKGTIAFAKECEEGTSKNVYNSGPAWRTMFICFAPMFLHAVFGFDAILDNVAEINK